MGIFEQRPAGADGGGVWFAALAGVVAFHAAAQLLVLGWSLTERPIPAAAAAMMLLVGAAAGGLAWRRYPRDPPGDAVADAAPGRGERRVRTVLLAAAGAVLAVLTAVALLTRDWTGDGNAYHIPTIHLWALRGHVHWVMPLTVLEPLMNGYPKGLELFAFLLTRATGCNAFVTTANLAFLPLGMLALAGLAQRQGASRAMAGAAGAAWALIPGHVTQAATAYVDSGYASCAAAFVALLAECVRRLADPARPPLRAPALALGGALGLALAAKGSGLFLGVAGFGVLAAAVLVCAWRAGAAIRWERAAAGTGLLARAGLVAVLVGGYWYARDWVLAGSPVYPAGVTVAGRVLFPGLPMADVIKEELNTPPEYQGYPAALKILRSWSQIGFPWCRWPGTIGGVDPRYGGLGWLWLLGGLPAVALCARRMGRLAPPDRAMLLAVLATVALAFLSQPMAWWARYTLWIHAAGLPCFAAVATQALRGGRPAARAWVAACVALAALEAAVATAGVVATAASTGLGWKQPADLLDPARWHRQACYLMPALQGSVFEEIFAGHDTVAVGPIYEQIGTGRWREELLGELCQPVGRRKLVPVPEHVDASTPAAFARRHVRYVLWSDAKPIPEVLLRAASARHTAPGFVVLVMPPYR